MSDDDSGSTIELNRRRILAGLGTIGVASAGAGAGTMALFSDEETSSGNSVQAGTLDLTTGNQSNVPINVPGPSDSSAGAKPGDGGRGSLTLTNSGSIDGSLDISVSNVATSPDDNSSGAEPSSFGSSYTFDIHYGYDQDSFWTSRYQYGSNSKFNDDSSESPIFLEDLGLDTAHTTVDLSGTNPKIKVELPKPLEGSEYVELFIDEGDQGGLNHYVGYESGSGYIKTPGSDFTEGTNEALPKDGYSVNTSNGGQTLTFTLGTSTPFGLSGHSSFEPSNFGGFGSGNAGSLMVELTPGANYTEGSFNTVHYGTTSTREIRIDGSLPTLEDLLEVEIAVFDDAASTSNGEIVASGLLSQIADTEYDLNRSVPGDSGSVDVVVNWDISKNAGNVIQGDTAEFDLTFELNQEDSQ